MKKTVFILLVILIGASTASAYTTYGAGFRMFYSSLQPYGEWIEIDYDLYVWKPYDAGYSWRPYSNGRWEWTNHGWYWVSYEPFGWATYHYGRWFYDDYYGWLWIPDTEWGPSWVEWRYNNNYIGWAPLPPYAHFSVNSGIYFSMRWNSGYYHWNFVDYRHFHSNRIHVHVVNNYQTYNIFNNTKYRTNYYYRDGRVINGGVDRRLVERNGGYRIKERSIETTTDVNTFRTRSNDVTKDRIISYKPGNSTAERDILPEREKIRKGNVNSSLNREKITIDRREVKDRTAAETGRKEIEVPVKRDVPVTRSEIEKVKPKSSENTGKIVKEKWLEINKTEKPDSTPNKSMPDIKRNAEIKSEKNVKRTESKTVVPKTGRENTVRENTVKVEKEKNEKNEGNRSQIKKRLQ